MTQTITIETGLRPASVDVEVLLPSDPPTAFLYLLHGGGGGEGFLERMAPVVRRAWDDGTLRPCVVAMPHASQRCFYMNFRDGSECWEDILAGPLVDELRRRHGLPLQRETTATCGVSMGGMGSLRLAFKHPDVFGAVAALEPGIEPVFAFADIALEDRFYRGPALYERIYGSPVDESHWQANNPANIARDEAGRLSVSGLSIYLECGDEDGFGLHRGAEFLHRVMFDNGVPHEYRLVRGADHVGASLAGRFADAFGFVGRFFDPPPPDPALVPFRERMAQLRARAGLTG